MKRKIFICALLVLSIVYYYTPMYCYLDSYINVNKIEMRHNNIVSMNYLNIKHNLDKDKTFFREDDYNGVLVYSNDNNNTSICIYKKTKSELKEIFERIINNQGILFNSHSYSASISNYYDINIIVEKYRVIHNRVLIISYKQIMYKPGIYEGVNKNYYIIPKFEQRIMIVGSDYLFTGIVISNKPNNLKIEEIVNICFN